MSKPVEVLEQELQAHQAKCDAAHAEIARVRDLLAKADARRQAEPENRRRWDSTIDNLEKSLREVKMRLEVAERAVRASEAELNAARDAGTGIDAGEALAEEALPVAELGAVDRILSMSVEELNTLNLAQLDELQQAAEAEARPDFAAAARPEPSASQGPSSGAMNREQRALRSGIVKVRLGLGKSITPLERILLRRLVVRLRNKPTEKTEALCRAIDLSLQRPD